MADEEIFFAAIRAGATYKEALYELEKVQRSDSIEPNPDRRVRLWQIFIKTKRGWQVGLITEHWGNVLDYVSKNNWEDWLIEGIIPILQKKHHGDTP